MNLNELMRKIDLANIAGCTAYIDVVYKVTCAFFNEEGYFSIETKRHGELTIFNIDTVDKVFDDGKISVSGGGETFIIEFIKE